MKFLTLPNAKRYEHVDYTYCVYVPGSRKDRVLLVAHADTVFYVRGQHKIILEDGVYRSGENDDGIGADDRAGCAILWQLRESGHSLLITNDEEIGCVGSLTLREKNPALFAELNTHSYMLQFDRRNATDYKVYDIPVTEEFHEFIRLGTGYTEAGRNSSTDIRHLCRDICGANLSVGYYGEHMGNEHLVFDEWQHTLDTARKLLAPAQKKYPLS